MTIVIDLYIIAMPWKREENILCNYLFGDKIIQNFAKKISPEV